ncbi:MULTISPECIES: hypothetical protein [unclassified Microcoleus]|nr:MULTISPECIES: hypothetical protein [unclassified Microcoleus]
MTLLGDACGGLRHRIPVKKAIAFCLCTRKGDRLSSHKKAIAL